MQSFLYFGGLIYFPYSRIKAGYNWPNTGLGVGLKACPALIPAFSSVMCSSWESHMTSQNSFPFWNCSCKAVGMKWRVSEDSLWNNGGHFSGPMLSHAQSYDLAIQYRTLWFLLDYSPVTHILLRHYYFPQHYHFLCISVRTWNSLLRFWSLDFMLTLLYLHDSFALPPFCAHLHVSCG